MADSDRLSDLSPARRRLLEKWRRGPSDRPQGVAIPRRDEGAPIPLAFPQQRFWFLDELYSDSAAYHVPTVLRMRGALEPWALARALSVVVRRHRLLRTVFKVRNGAPVQVVEPFTPSPLPLADLNGLPEAAKEQEAGRVAGHWVRRPFDLARGPLWRLLLVRLDAEDHCFALSMHHIVSDGWSLGILLRELETAYRAALSGEPPSLPKLPIQYGDFAAWQRQRREDPTLKKQLAYWEDALEGAPGSLDLPTDRQRPPIQGTRGDAETFRFSRELTTALRELGSDSGQSTLFVVLVAGVFTLLHRLTGQEDILLGTPVANRLRPEVEPLIGPFINTLVLRAKPTPNLPFRELLEQVRHTVLEAFAHQDLPFEALVQHLDPEREASRTPLFQVVFVYQNVARTGAGFAGLEVAELPFRMGTSMFDLTLAMGEGGDGALTGRLEYDTDLLDEETIDSWIDCLEVLLTAVADDPDRELADLPLLDGAPPPSAEEDQGRRDTVQTPIPRLFEAQAAASPDAVAVVGDGEHWSYSALDARADRIAHRLRSFGVAPETVVGVLLERSPTLPAAILGVLKAGGAYLPLEVSYPRDRLVFMLDDARARVLLTQESLRPHASGWTGEILDLETLSPWPTDADSGDCPVPLAPEHLAYLIYTSGSTGRPKGVMVTHANAVRLFATTRRWFRFGPEDVGTLFHSTAFDFSVWEIWAALLYGGRLVVVPRGVTRSPETFHALLRRERVTVLNQTPSAFRELVRADATSRGRSELSLREVVFGGEALALASLSPWLERHGDERPRLVNMYGITETTVHVTYRRIRRSDVGRRAGSPIGEPIPDLEVHVLDRRMRPLPPGVPGEMFVGGEGVARGYLQRADLTAERFLPDPFGGNGARLYRTGDLGRRRRDGNLEFLGRADHQVKIRGFRIELGEIEARIRERPEVRDAVVVVGAENPEHPRLVAYLVGRDGPVGIAALRHSLRESLPDYMVPVVFQNLDELPRTAGGKVDRRRLPAPDGGRPEQEVAYIAPRSELERTIGALWQELLRVDRVGIHDNFFDLGGDSLLLVQLHGRLRERLGRGVPLIELVRNPTIDALARRLGDDPSRRPAEPPQQEDPGKRLSEGLGRLRRRRAAMEGGRTETEEDSR